MEGLLHCWFVLLCLTHVVRGDCPCSFNTTTHSADCSWQWGKTKLWKVPDCVPSDTRWLSLARNDLLYEPGQFQRLTALEYLDLSWNTQFKPANDSFSGLVNLQVLYINNTDLYNEFHTALFTEPSNLKVLSLRESVLSFIPNGFFSNLKHLLSLDLSHNDLTTLEAETFTGLSNLRSLNMEANWRLTLTDHILDGLSGLEVLDISGCGIRTIGMDLFSDLNMLTDLDLGSNMISSLDADRFVNLSQLVHLDLRNNMMQGVTKHSFNGLSAITTLSLQSNKLEIDNEVAREIFRPFQRLEHLNIKHGLSPTFTPEVLPKLFLPLQSLIHLDLSENNLTTLPKDTFQAQHQLMELRLDDNHLEIVSFDVRQMEKLEVLDVRNNNIAYITPHATHGIDILKQHSNITIFIDGNPLLCDCRHSEFVSWLSNTHAVYNLINMTCEFENGTQVSLSEVKDLYDYLVVRCDKLSCECDSGSFDAWLHGTHIAFQARTFSCQYPNGSQVNFEGNPELIELVRQKCIAKFILIGCILTFGVQTLGYAFASYVWYSRERFKYLLTIGRRNLNPYHPLEEGEIQLDNDVYISYEGDSQVTPDKTLHELVTQTIYPELKRLGYSVIIREEFQPGIGLYNSISLALRKTKKVVALVSADYCKNYWNTFEFNTAVLEGIYTKRQIIFAIAVTPLNPRDLSKDVLAFLSSRPIPYFSRNVSEDTFMHFLTDGIRDIWEYE